MKLAGKNAIVTGANRSFGRCMAQALAEQGANVVISYRSDEAGAMQTLELIQPYGHKATAFYADFSDPTQVNIFGEKAIAFLGGVDMLVNNAGVGNRDEFLDVTPEAMAAVYQINVIAPLQLAQICARHMIAYQTKGRIVNISSIVALCTFAHGVAYASSKAAMNKSTQNIALDLAKHGICVNAVAPGVIESGLNETTAETNPALWEKYFSQIPLQRAGTPEDVTSMVLFLLSEQASWITGKVFPVDGGHVL